jgi:hypothetical protein
MDRLFLVACFQAYLLVCRPCFHFRRDRKAGHLKAAMGFQDHRHQWENCQSATRMARIRFRIQGAAMVPWRRDRQFHQEEPVELIQGLVAATPEVRLGHAQEEDHQSLAAVREQDTAASSQLAIRGSRLEVHTHRIERHFQLSRIPDHSLR